MIIRELPVYYVIGISYFLNIQFFCIRQRNSGLNLNSPRSRLTFLGDIVCIGIYSVEITYGINSVISKLMTFAENAETSQFLFLIMLILSYFACS
jgi:hypothetical protein